jgi:5-methylcytosine-specific restriction endonuclease McrA
MALPQGPGRAIMSAEMRRGKVKRLLVRDGGYCWLCDGWLGDDITLDHVVPRSKGGTNQDANLRLAHKRCNKERGDSDAVLVAEGKWRIVCVGEGDAL